MPGFTLSRTDARGNVYPEAYHSISMTSLEHFEQRGFIIVSAWRDKASFDARLQPAVELQRVYRFEPAAQDPIRDMLGNLIQDAMPPYADLFSEEALTGGNNPFIALYTFLLGRPEFEGAVFVP